MSRCLQVYKAGGIVALPSDTLYGVTSLISHSEKLYSLKQRNRQMPLGLFLNNVREVQRLANFLKPDEIFIIAAFSFPLALCSQCFNLLFNFIF